MNVPGETFGTRTADNIRRAGLTMIFQRGYEATTLRDLAAEVGIKAPSLYNHMRTKQELLFELIQVHMTSLLKETDLALTNSPIHPLGQLTAFIENHIKYHVERKQEVFIANFELRSLDVENYTVIVSMRKAYEERLISLLDAGVASGELDVEDTRIAAYAILAMLTGACTWYRPDGRLSPYQVVQHHLKLVLHGCAKTAPNS